MIALWAAIGILVVIGGAAAYVVACREAIAALEWEDEEPTRCSHCTGCAMPMRCPVNRAEQDAN